MINRLQSLIALITTMLCISQTANANNNVTIVCNSCSITQMYQAVSSDYQATGHSGNYLLKDYDSGTFEKVKMMYEPEVNQSFITSVNIPSEEEVAFFLERTSFDTFRFYTGQSFKTYLSNNAYEFAGNSSLQRQLLDDYNNNSFVVRELKNIALSIGQMSLRAVQIGALNTITEVELADGGKAFIELNGFVTSGMLASANYKLVKIVDVDGNEVPEIDLTDSRLIFKFVDLDNFNVFMDFMQQHYDLNRDEIEVTFIERLGNPKKPAITIVDIDNGQGSVQTPPQDEDTKEDP